MQFVIAQINKKVHLLGPVLDQGRKRRYHDRLVSKSVSPMFGIKLPAPLEIFSCLFPPVIRANDPGDEFGAARFLKTVSPTTAHRKEQITVRK